MDEVIVQNNNVVDVSRRKKAKHDSSHMQKSNRDSDRERKNKQS
jgi:hypothetical protein